MITSYPLHLNKRVRTPHKLTGRGPTELAGFETMHISHILEQDIRGYLCGSNNKTWNKNIFYYKNSQTAKKVKTYFYRFEFQQRGTVHLHLVVWLKNVKKYNIDLFEQIFLGKILIVLSLLARLSAQC
jgi:hypothetical protein